jgi:hypothetical protein
MSLTATSAASNGWSKSIDAAREANSSRVGASNRSAHARRESRSPYPSTSDFPRFFATAPLDTRFVSL